MPETPITLTFFELTFFEPYRLIAWCEEEQKTGAEYLRGQGLARCRKDAAGGGVKTLQITGTLLRSAVIRAAEELICLKNNNPENDRYGKCCPGEFKTVGGEKPYHLRKRPTLVKIPPERPAVCQSRKDACALCLLLGRFDKAGKCHGNKGDYDIHFNNLNLIRNGKSIKLSDIATERGFNRVNYHTGKARDYFKMWEVDDEDYWTFQGVITVNEQEKTDEQRRQLDLLLSDSLGFVDKLCGAICRITIVQKEFNHKGTKKNLQISPKDVREEPTGGLSEEIRNNLKKSAKDIVDAFDKSDKIEKARTLADVVRAMRLEKPDIMGKLPKGRDGKDHHLWDIKVGDKTIRQVLDKLWKAVQPPRVNINEGEKHTPCLSQEGNRESPLQGGDLGVGGLTRETHDVSNKWRPFCETLGNNIYREYKEKTGGFSPHIGILGEAVEYHARPDTSDTCITLASGNTVTMEWIIVGNLKAITPFFFGTESGEGDQTSYRILLNKKGQYRIPRSLMRGVLRRDLRTAFDSGCNAEPGGMMPCNCPVCIIMRRITIMDSRSNAYKEPPDIRYRIRMNPQTATVDEGALFDMEVGPEGITFPFVLRYRAEGEFPAELWSVIRYWMDGMAWLGGSGSTGKGRFALVEGDVKVYTWELSDDGIKAYIEKGGLRGNIVTVTDTLIKAIENKENKEKRLHGLDDVTGQPGDLKNYAPYQKYLQPQWEEIAYTITIAAPLLTADTISALLDPDNRDSIAYRKRVFGKKEGVLVVKGETIRGIVRTAVGKQQGILGKEHEDCDCESCTTFINIFGNEHEAGKIRFEDLEVKTAQNCKKIDHVAIDRFTGGAVDKKKFDTYPIAGSPTKPILLKGTFWMKRDLADKERELIGDALLDIKQGFYPIGGKTGIGYGWVSDLAVKGDSGYFSDLAEGKGKTDAQEAPSEVCPPYNKPRPSPILPDGKHGERFYPHYFLEPDKDVKRESFLPELGHEKFNRGLLTGKIRCSLKTLTPLIIPDSRYEYEFCNDAETIQVKTLCSLLTQDIGDKISLTAAPDSVDWLNELLNKPNLYDLLKKPDSDLPEDILELVARTQAYRTSGFSISGESGIYVRILNCRILEKWYLQKKPEISEISRHKSYPFFRINEHFQIPGSEIKGAVSPVYEAITNSCFRVLDEQGRLSWRMPAENLNKILKKGRIVKGDNGDFKVEIYEKSARLPFYDDDTVFEALRKGDLRETQINGKEPLKLWVKELLPKASLVTPWKSLKWKKVKGSFSKPEPNKYSIEFTVEGKRQRISKVVAESEKETYDGLPDGAKINFWFKKSRYYMASISIGNQEDKTGWVQKEGYLKITGPNKVEIGEIDSPSKDSVQFSVSEGIPEDWKEIRINEEKQEGKKIRVFRCKQGKKLYTMSKWCETFFYNELPGTKEIPPDVYKQYERLIEKYRDNPQKPPEVFQSLPVKPRKEDRSETPDTSGGNTPAEKPPGKREEEYLRAGDLVYVILDELEKTVKEIFPVYISRTMDEDVLGIKMKKMGQSNLRPCECEADEDTSHPEKLCPACRLFGTTSYKGRVRFGFASLTNKPEGRVDKEKDSVGYLTIPLLEKPRPTWSMPDKNYKVPGRKFYVHHNGREKAEENRNENNRSVETLAKDNEFTFDVFFENLEKWELGLLLYSLELEPENNLVHKMGMAKAHGFGSVQITTNNFSFKVNPIMYKMVNGSRCKNRLIDTGYAKLREWDGAGKEWYDIPHIQKLRKLLTYEKENKRKVEYPELEGEEGLPGYVELGKKENWLFKDRVECLTTPWSPWHPHATPKDDKHDSKPEAKVPVTSDKSPAHKEDRREIIAKSKDPPANKCSGIVKWFNEKKGFGFIIKDRGGDVFVHISAINDGTILKEGQRVVFDVVPSAKGFNARNVAVVDL